MFIFQFYSFSSKLFKIIHNVVNELKYVNYITRCVKERFL